MESFNKCKPPIFLIKFIFNINCSSFFQEKKTNGNSNAMGSARSISPTNSLQDNVEIVITGKDLYQVQEKAWVSVQYKIGSKQNHGYTKDGQ